MRALITGGAGFIGSHLCDRFYTEGHEIICVDNLVTGTLDNIAHLQGKPRFTFVRHDISKPIQPDGPIDYVLHFASPASPVDYLKYPIQTLKVGALGTHNVLGIARATGAKFLLASTSEVYGDPQVHPQPESYQGNVNCVGPRGVYDEAKRFAEALTMAYHREHHVNTQIVRIFNTYGSRMRRRDGRVIPTFMTQALCDEPLTISGDGSQTRSFCYVDDLVEGIMRLLRSDCVGPINLGNPEEHTILELAQTIIEVTKSTSTMVFRDLPKDDPKRRCPDVSVASRELGWQTETPLSEGLRNTIEWFAGLLKGGVGGRTSGT